LKRRANLCLSLVLGLALMACLAGCGDCPAAARRELARGESIMKGVLPKAGELLDGLDRLFTDYAAGVNTEPYGVWQDMDEYGLEASRLVERSRKARVAYENVLGMKSAGACAAYARQRLSAIGQIDRIPRVAEAGFQAIRSGDRPGEIFDESPLFRLSRSLIQINIEMRYAMGYADALGKKLGLESPAE